ncbi:uncharacterized protein LOC130766098 [Actinidia eriantha]|uniref:uncharacterized protein LOC130766098 n=1 Tax=Actinidia eriantha TaxID=165200 RepID=UPI00258677F8|nr:uncharacterized protein LOC130766098 [Actinidia eriantha]
MANNIALREILSILKERDPSNTKGIKSIYNAIQRHGYTLTKSDLFQHGLIHRYIFHTVDVQPDSHCGFRMIAALIEYGEEGWFQWAPEMNWTDSIPLGIVIASRYNLVLHTFGENVGSCFTHLPLRTPLVPNQERLEIAIVHVGNHFVQVFLHSHYPIALIPMWWWQHSSYEAKGWAARYETRVHLWSEIFFPEHG